MSSDKVVYLFLWQSVKILKLMKSPRRKRIFYFVLWLIHPDLRDLMPMYIYQTVGYIWGWKAQKKRKHLTMKTEKNRATVSYETWSTGAWLGRGVPGVLETFLSHLDPSLCQFLERPYCNTYHWSNSFWWFGASSLKNAGYAPVENVCHVHWSCW